MLLEAQHSVFHVAAVRTKDVSWAIDVTHFHEAAKMQFQFVKLKIKSLTQTVREELKGIATVDAEQQ